jgi:hypothetical protein
MPVITVRLSEEEKVILDRRAAAAGLKAGTLVRKLIADEPLVKGAEILSYVESHLGDKRLRIKPVKKSA